LPNNADLVSKMVKLNSWLEWIATLDEHEDRLKKYVFLKGGLQEFKKEHMNINGLVTRLQRGDKVDFDDWEDTLADIQASCNKGILDPNVCEAVKKLSQEIFVLGKQWAKEI
jgi:hypothetical protein